MKRLLVFLLAACLLVPSVPTAAPSKALQSVKPIAIPVGDSAGVGMLTNICTAASINEQERYWLTAAHCVLVAPHLRYYILGEEVQVVKIAPVHDLAILQTASVSAPALNLAARDVMPEDRVKVAGYPLGWLYPVITLGTVMHGGMPLHPDFPPFMILQVAGAPGHSGSPVVNYRDEIVSVVQIGWDRSFGSVMGGTPWLVLKHFTEGYFGA